MKSPTCLCSRFLDCFAGNLPRQKELKEIVLQQLTSTARVGASFEHFHVDREAVMTAWRRQLSSYIIADKKVCYEVCRVLCETQPTIAHKLLSRHLDVYLRFFANSQTFEQYFSHPSPACDAFYRYALRKRMEMWDSLVWKRRLLTPILAAQSEEKFFQEINLPASLEALHRASRPSETNSRDSPFSISDFYDSSEFRQVIESTVNSRSAFDAYNFITRESTYFADEITKLLPWRNDSLRSSDCTVSRESSRIESTLLHFASTASLSDLLFRAVPSLSDPQLTEMLEVLSSEPGSVLSRLTIVLRNCMNGERDSLAPQASRIAFAIVVAPLEISRILASTRSNRLPQLTASLRTQCHKPETQSRDDASKLNNGDDQRDLLQCEHGGMSIASPSFGVDRGSRVDDLMCDNRRKQCLLSELLVSLDAICGGCLISGTSHVSCDTEFEVACLHSFQTLLENADVLTGSSQTDNKESVAELPSAFLKFMVLHSLGVLAIAPKLIERISKTVGKRYKIRKQVSSSSARKRRRKSRASDYIDVLQSLHDDACVDTLGTHSAECDVPDIHGESIVWTCKGEGGKRTVRTVEVWNALTDAILSRVTTPESVGGHVGVDDL